MLRNNQLMIQFMLQRNNQLIKQKNKDKPAQATIIVSSLKALMANQKDTFEKNGLK